MDKNKLRRFLFEKDKQNPGAINNTGLSNPTLGNHLPGSVSLSMPKIKSSASSMSSGLSNPMGMHPGLSKPPGIKESLPNPTAAPSIIGKQPKLPKMDKFAKTRNYFKK